MERVKFPTKKLCRQNSVKQIGPKIENSSIIGAPGQYYFDAKGLLRSEILEKAEKIKKGQY